MSDYTKTTDFAAKDALASGNAAKAAKGTEVDTEFDNIATAIATKFDVNDRDVANGLCPLDTGSLVPVGNLPVATESAIGALEIATVAEAVALAADNKWITPLKINDAVGAYNLLLEGNLSFFHTLVDPNVDTLYGWDDSATNSATFTLGTGLAFNATPGIELDFLGLEDLVDPGADRLIGWDDTAGFLKFWNTADGLSFDNGAVTFGLTDVAATTTNPIDIASGAISFNISALDQYTVTDVDVLNDSFIVNDNGVIKELLFDDTGIKINEFTADFTLALADVSVYRMLTGTTNRVVDIPTNGSVAYNIGTTILLGSRDTAIVTVSPNTSAVRLTSGIRSDVGPTAGDHTITAGGLALLIKVATDEWQITGDIT